MKVYVVPLKGGKEPKEITDQEHGAVHSVVFNRQGTQIAWLQLAKDGYESDRAQVVVYDIESETRFNVAEGWDRSPSAITVCLSRTVLIQLLSLRQIVCA